MINSIKIADVATFCPSPEVLNDLSQFNFLFGSNGSGKTTISRIIADEAPFPACEVVWEAGARLQALVYNSDFVERNFNQSPELKGVFTLGEKQVDTLQKITAAKEKLDELTKKIGNLTATLHGTHSMIGKTGELDALEEAFRTKCWRQKQQHDEKLGGAFAGYRNSAQKFKENILQESGSNAAVLLTLDELEKKAQTVFGRALAAESAVPAVDMGRLLSHEGNPILKKRVIGNDEVDIAAMIRKLGNSDWVRQGKAFYDQNDGVCPFCQQATPGSFAQCLSEYFDETFAEDSAKIEEVSSSYATDATKVQQQIASLIASRPRFLDAEKLKAEKDLLDSIITLNHQRLEGKRKEPSGAVNLESLAVADAAINGLISAANAAAVEHNKVVKNLAIERQTLTAQVWRFILEQLNADLCDYNKSCAGLSKAITSLNNQIRDATADKKKKSEEIRDLERLTTSVEPTIDGINGLLSSFGFSSFKLAKAANGTSTSYKLVRADGTDAKPTLSEGEKNFVTFLYFYHLVKGSDSETGMTTDRIVVFDDPVSSLDSDILFIVSSLVKGLFDEVRAGAGHIKQVFVLTHNVYFHRDVTFNPKRGNDRALREETFWTVRKSGLISRLDRHEANPVKTSYELLWSEVRGPNPREMTIQNTLRRILESYFKVLGGVDPDSICALFEGREKLVCKSLFSWVNAGSHHALDDLYVSVGEATVDVYLRVFKDIFNKSGHLAHYQMMMGDELAEEPLPG